MAVNYIRSERAVFPAAASQRSAKRIERVEVVLEDGQRVTLGEAAVELISLLREGLAAAKTAHLELDEESVSPERAAALLGVTRPTIYTWQDRGRLGRINVGSRRMVPLLDIERLRNSRVRQAALSAARLVNLDEPDEPLTEEEMQAFTSSF